MIVAHTFCIIFKMINWFRPRYEHMQLKKLMTVAQFFVYMASIINVQQKNFITVGRVADRKLDQFRTFELVVFYCQLGALAGYLLICRTFMRLYTSQKTKSKEDYSPDPFYHLISNNE